MRPLVLIHTLNKQCKVLDTLLKLKGVEFPVRHVVDEDILRNAKAKGQVDELLDKEFAEIVNGVDKRQQPLIVCTCSTFGDSADRIDNYRVERIDRPMAQKAVDMGNKIIVAAALKSTLKPTTELIKKEAAHKGISVQVNICLCDDAWGYFENGDDESYWKSIAEKLKTEDGKADVIVLAQASMAGAVKYCDDMKTTILNSLDTGVEFIIAEMEKGPDRPPLPKNRLN